MRSQVSVWAEYQRNTIVDREPSSSQANESNNGKKARQTNQIINQDDLNNFGYSPDVDVKGDDSPVLCSSVQVALPAEVDIQDFLTKLRSNPRLQKYPTLEISSNLMGIFGFDKQASPHGDTLLDESLNADETCQVADNAVDITHPRPELIKRQLTTSQLEKVTREIQSVKKYRDNVKKTMQQYIANCQSEMESYTQKIASVDCGMISGKEESQSNNQSTSIKTDQTKNQLRPEQLEKFNSFYNAYSKLWNDYVHQYKTNAELGTANKLLLAHNIDLQKKSVQIDKIIKLIGKDKDSQILSKQPHSGICVHRVKQLLEYVNTLEHKANQMEKLINKSTKDKQNHEISLKKLQQQVYCLQNGIVNTKIENRSIHNRNSCLKEICQVQNQVVESKIKHIDNLELSLSNIKQIKRLVHSILVCSNQHSLDTTEQNGLDDQIETTMEQIKQYVITLQQSIKQNQVLEEENLKFQSVKQQEYSQQRQNPKQFQQDVMDQIQLKQLQQRNSQIHQRYENAHQYICQLIDVINSGQKQKQVKEIATATEHSNMQQEAQTEVVTQNTTAVTADIIKQKSLKSVSVLTDQCTVEYEQQGVLTDHCTLEYAQKGVLTDHCTLEYAQKGVLTDQCTAESAHQGVLTDQCAVEYAQQGILTDQCTIEYQQQGTQTEMGSKDIQSLPYCEKKAKHACTATDKASSSSFQRVPNQLKQTTSSIELQKLSQSVEDEEVKIFLANIGLNDEQVSESNGRLSNCYTSTSPSKPKGNPLLAQSLPNQNQQGSSQNNEPSSLIKAPKSSADQQLASRSIAQYSLPETDSLTQPLASQDQWSIQPSDAANNLKNQTYFRSSSDYLSKNRLKTSYDYGTGLAAKAKYSSNFAKAKDQRTINDADDDEIERFLSHNQQIKHSNSFPYEDLSISGKVRRMRKIFEAEAICGLRATNSKFTSQEPKSPVSSQRSTQGSENIKHRPYDSKIQDYSDNSPTCKACKTEVSTPPAKQIKLDNLSKIEPCALPQSHEDSKTIQNRQYQIGIIEKPSDINSSEYRLGALYSNKKGPFPILEQESSNPNYSELNSANCSTIDQTLQNQGSYQPKNPISDQRAKYAQVQLGRYQGKQSRSKGGVMSMASIAQGKTNIQIDTTNQVKQSKREQFQGNSSKESTLSHTIFLIEVEWNLWRDQVKHLSKPLSCTTRLESLAQGLQVQTVKLGKQIDDFYGSNNPRTTFGQYRQAKVFHSVLLANVKKLFDPIQLLQAMKMELQGQRSIGQSNLLTKQSANRLYLSNANRALLADYKPFATEAVVKKMRTLTNQINYSISAMIQILQVSIKLNNEYKNSQAAHNNAVQHCPNCPKVKLQLTADKDSKFNIKTKQTGRFANFKEDKFNLQADQSRVHRVGTNLCVCVRQGQEAQKQDSAGDASPYLLSSQREQQIQRLRQQLRHSQSSEYS